MFDKDVNKKVVIECDCGTHLLKVQNQVEYFNDNIYSNKIRFRQEYYLAMFYYGIDSEKRNWWDRIVIAFKYIWSGKMFADQLCLSPDEALKLSTFINETLIKGDVSFPVYAFMYNSCVHESSWATISLHSSLEGAQKAMEEHKKKARDEFNEIIDGNDNDFKFGEDEDWCVKTFEVLS